MDVPDQSIPVMLLCVCCILLVIGAFHINSRLDALEDHQEQCEPNLN